MNAKVKNRLIMAAVMAVVAAAAIWGGVWSQTVHKRTEYSVCEIDGHRYYRITDGHGHDIGVVHSPDCQCNTASNYEKEQDNGTGLHQGGQESRQNERDSVSRETDIDTAHADSSIQESLQAQ